MEPVQETGKLEGYWYYPSMRVGPPRIEPQRRGVSRVLIGIPPRGTGPLEIGLLSKGWRG